MFTRINRTHPSPVTPNLVEVSGGTIGKAGTGAIYEGETYFELYAWWWLYPDNNGAVVDGEVWGVSALADWNAGKKITMPNFANGPLEWKYLQLDDDYTKIAALQTGKANVSHTHTAADITDFTEAAQDALALALSSEFVYNDGSNTITARPRTFDNPSRTLNSAFQISGTRDAAVSYSIDTATNLSLAGGAVGTTYLRYADDSAHTTNVKEVARFVNGNTGTLTIGLNISQSATGTLTGIVPAGKYAKIVTENTTGTPVFTYRSGQEVLL